MELTTKAFFIGRTFFLIRLILAIIYGHYAQSVKIESNSSYKINVIISIILAVGALVDLGLLIGSVMKNKILLYIWIGAQFLVGKEKLTPPWSSPCVITFFLISKFSYFVEILK